MLRQAELCVNLLRNARVNPTLSAWSYLFRPFDFNKTPLAPPGTKLVIHKKPTNRKSWDFHGEDGYYIGPAMDHYRCITAYIPKTHSERVTDTATLIPNVVPIPETTVEDHVKATATQLLKLLTNKTHPIGPFLKETTKHQLIEIVKLFNRDTSPSITIPSL